MQSVLAELEHDGLIEPLRRGGALRIWFLTEAGGKLAEARPDREERRRHKVFESGYYAEFHAAHTLRVNDVGVAFLEAARARGDTFTARSWRHEIAHPIGPPPGMRRGELVITDAVFSYLHRADSGASIHYRFVELDRATLLIDRLIAKLARYTRLYRFRPKAARGKQAEQAWAGALSGLPHADGGVRRSAAAQARVAHAGGRAALPAGLPAQPDAAGRDPALPARGPRATWSVRPDLLGPEQGREIGQLDRRARVAPGARRRGRHLSVPGKRRGGGGEAATRADVARVARPCACATCAASRPTLTALSPRCSRSHSTSSSASG
jgi:hypothetical protein